MKNRFFFALPLLLLVVSAHAETHAISSGQTYIGAETLNERLTGQKCFVVIRSVTPLPEKGLHCHSVEFQFAFNRPDVPKDDLTVTSRVTNYHRSEFPKVRTCALNVDGTSSGDEIYGDDTASLYNQIFGGSHSNGGIRYDYFLTLRPDTKQPARARVHIMEKFSERDVDCVGLERM